MPDVFDTLTDAPAHDIFDLVGPEDSPTPETDKAVAQTPSLIQRAVALAKTPSPEVLRKPEEAVRQYVKGMVPGDIKGALRMMNVPTDFNSPEQLTQFVFPMLQPAIQTLEGIKGRAAQIREAEKTPAGSQERWNAGIGTALDLAQLATIFKGGELIGERASTARPEGESATLTPPKAQTRPIQATGGLETPSGKLTREKIPIGYEFRAPNAADDFVMYRYEGNGEVTDLDTGQTHKLSQKQIDDTEGFIRTTPKYPKGVQPGPMYMLEPPASLASVYKPKPFEETTQTPQLKLLEGEPNAQQPSNAQVQTGDTTLGVETRPQGAEPQTGSSDNVIGETGGEKPLVEGQAPQEDVAVKHPEIPPLRMQSYEGAPIEELIADTVHDTEQAGDAALNKLDPNEDAYLRRRGDKWVVYRHPEAIKPVAVAGRASSKDANTHLGEVSENEGSTPSPTTEPVKYYHGTHQKVSELAPREVKSVDSLGTWVTSDPQNAKTLYGPNVHQVDVPQSRLLEFDGSDPSQNDFNRVLGANARIAEEVGLTKEAEILSQTLPDTRRLTELTRKFETEGGSSALTPSENAERIALNKAEQASNTLLRSKAYNQAFRKMLEDQGYEGIVWKNSRVDLRAGDPAHDVAVIFHKEPISVQGISEHGQVRQVRRDSPAVSRQSTQRSPTMSDLRTSQGSDVGVGRTPRGAEDQTTLQRPVVTQPEGGGEPAAAAVSGAETPPAAEPQRAATSLQNAVTEAERINRGLGPREAVESQSWDKAKSIAQSEAATDPGKGARLVEELNQQPRALDDVEGVHLLNRKVEVNREFDSALENLRRNPDDVDAIARMTKAREDAYKMYQATEASGTAWGRGGRIRQAMMADDYSMSRMEATRRVANKGKPLSTSQMMEVADHYSKISKQEARIKVAEDSLQTPSGRMRPQEILNAVEQMKRRLTPCL